MKIKFIPREEIDKVKWNSCVHYANNGNIFGYMWFLDFIGKEWDALIEGDYESVMPLVWREGTFRRKEVFQPALMRELGVYSINVLSRARIGKFLEAIPEEYRSVEITMNEQNILPDEHAFQTDRLTNHQLIINKPYETLAEGFSSDLLRTLEKAQDYELRPASNMKPEKVADFYLKHTKDKKEKDIKFHGMQRVMYNILHRGWGMPVGVANKENELIAVGFMIYSHNKIISFVSEESKEGKEKGALAFMYNLLMRSHAGRPLLWDFNTSVKNELALAFGALPNNYTKVRKKASIWSFFR